MRYFFIFVKVKDWLVFWSLDNRTTKNKKLVEWKWNSCSKIFWNRVKIDSWCIAWLIHVIAGCRKFKHLDKTSRSCIAALSVTPLRYYYEADLQLIPHSRITLQTCPTLQLNSISINVTFYCPAGTLMAEKITIKIPYWSMVESQYISKLWTLTQRQTQVDGWEIEAKFEKLCFSEFYHLLLINLKSWPWEINP